MRVGVLVVAYNAVGTLVNVLRRIPPTVWDQIEEVAVFDDASGDSTYELAVGYKALSDAYKLQIVKNERNLGYGGNQKAGYQYFIEKGFDAVVLLHGDGQYAPEILHHLYHPIVAGEADAVFGSRMMPQYGGALRGGMPLYKYLGNRILSSFENRALRMQLTEFHSGYRAYSLQALRKIDMSRMTDDFHFDTEIIIKLHHQGFRIEEVPIPTYYGNEICYVNGPKYALDVYRAVRRYKATIRGAHRYPEFAEYFANCPLEESPYSGRAIVARLIGGEQDVLDAGSDEDTLAARLAQPAGTTFDKVLLLDVLPRLSDPEPPLRAAASLLRANGQAIVTLPNVANLSVRLGLLFGRFEYSDRGILNHSDLRFYTRDGGRALFRRCGLRVVSERASVTPLQPPFGLPPNGRAMRCANRVLAFFTALFPKVLGYQWIFVVRPE